MDAIDHFKYVLAVYNTLVSDMQKRYDISVEPLTRRSASAGDDNDREKGLSTGDPSHVIRGNIDLRGTRPQKEVLEKNKKEFASDIINAHARVAGKAGLDAAVFATVGAVKGFLELKNAIEFLTTVRLFCHMSCRTTSPPSPPPPHRPAA